MLRQGERPLRVTSCPSRRLGSGSGMCAKPDIRPRASAMRRWTDLHLAESERRQCATKRHSPHFRMAVSAAVRSTSAFGWKGDLQICAILLGNRRPEIGVDNFSYARFSPNPDPRCAYRNDAFPSGDRHSRRCHSIAGSRRSAPLERMSAGGRGCGIQRSLLQSRFRRPRLTASGPAYPRPEITPGPPICFVARFPCRFRHLV